MQLDKRQKTLLVLIVIACAYIAWQLYDMFSNKSESDVPAPVAQPANIQAAPAPASAQTPAPTPTSATQASGPSSIKQNPQAQTATPATNSVSQNAPQQPVYTPPSAPEQKSASDILTAQDKSSPSYQLMKQYQQLQSEQFLLQQKLAVAEMKQKISELNTKLSQLSPGDVSTSTENKVTDYKLMYIDYQDNHWAATVAESQGNGTLHNVRNGSLLPNNVKVLRVDANGVVLSTAKGHVLLTFEGASFVNHKVSLSEIVNESDTHPINKKEVSNTPPPEIAEKPQVEAIQTVKLSKSVVESGKARPEEVVSGHKKSVVKSSKVVSSEVVAVPAPAPEKNVAESSKIIPPEVPAPKYAPEKATNVSDKEANFVTELTKSTKTEKAATPPEMVREPNLERVVPEATVRSIGLPPVSTQAVPMTSQKSRTVVESLKPTYSEKTATEKMPGEIVGTPGVVKAGNAAMMPIEPQKPKATIEVQKTTYTEKTATEKMPGEIVGTPNVVKAGPSTAAMMPIEPQKPKATIEVQKTTYTEKMATEKMPGEIVGTPGVVKAEDKTSSLPVNKLQQAISVKQQIPVAPTGKEPISIESLAPKAPAKPVVMPIVMTKTAAPVQAQAIEQKPGIAPAAIQSKFIASELKNEQNISAKETPSMIAPSSVINPTIKTETVQPKSVMQKLAPAPTQLTPAKSLIKPTSMVNESVKPLISAPEKNIVKTQVLQTPPVVDNSPVIEITKSASSYQLRTTTGKIVQPDVTASTKAISPVKSPIIVKQEQKFDGGSSNKPIPAVTPIVPSNATKQNIVPQISSPKLEENKGLSNSIKPEPNVEQQSTLSKPSAINQSQKTVPQNIITKPEQKITPDNTIIPKPVPQNAMPKPASNIPVPAPQNNMNDDSNSAVILDPSKFDSGN